MTGDEREHGKQAAQAEQLIQSNRALQEDLLRLRQEYTASQQELEETRRQLREAEREKQSAESRMLQSQQAFENVQRSHGWKVLQLLWRISSFLLPMGSMRRTFLKIIWKFLRHPISFLRQCTPDRISKFWRESHRQGMTTALKKLDEKVAGLAPEDKMHLRLFEVKDGEYPLLALPQNAEPLVSIVIPVYNQFNYTYLCLRSIVEYSSNVPYEIILADDGSTDRTQTIAEIVRGLRIVRNQQNLRFLKNCNHAAKEAKGKYILFLNNDTQVQPDWLTSLVELIEQDEKIGMVGSKLVYPDGSLQEAGGIVWKDGSAWNFGRGKNPLSPEFNYVKETDYISGAAIMIRRALWEEIGGFDEQFAPAYFEDTDLAFGVRKHGYKVMYQPASVVVHFEGVSNGTDTASGQKSYQLVNQKKFTEKWKDVLEKEHFKNGENVFSARDRSAGKETVLVIDHYIPTYDKDAGSRSMDTYLQLLTKMGFNVKFMGDNFYYDIPYARHYEQMGIEILCGNFYARNWKSWVNEHGKYLDYVLLSRPNISIKHIDMFKEKTKAKIIYYVQDLHFLREQREYEITHDPERLKSSQEFKKQEMYIMDRADVVFTLSSVEKAIIDENIPGEKAVIIPISCYYDFPETPATMKGKKDILFVGGFGHRPNENAVLWFAENVWPMVKKELPDSRWVIIGSHPTEKVLELQGDERILVTGFVSDEELEDYYDNKCRACVIPLQYGAGVKGKTLEAMYHRVPIISTSVGIEGLYDIEKYVQPTDDATSFADKVVALYRDDRTSEELAQRYYDYLKKTNSYERVRKIFAGVFSKN